MPRSHRPPGGLVCATLLALLAGAALPLGAARAAGAVGAERPARGALMSEVETRYGAPASRQPAVGQPPITRWDYPGLVVYFENERVIHAVIVRPGD